VFLPAPVQMAKKGRNKKEDPKKAAKAAAKKAAVEAEKKIREALKAALQVENPLAVLPAAFTAYLLLLKHSLLLAASRGCLVPGSLSPQSILAAGHFCMGEFCVHSFDCCCSRSLVCESRYNRNGLQCAVEHHTPATLPPADLATISRMLRSSGADGSAQRQLGDDDARLLLVRAAVPDAESAESAPPTSPSKEEAEPASPAASPAKEPGEDGSDSELKPGAVAAFVMFGYEIEAEALLLRLHELQVAPVARRKGLGKFAVMLSEMVARKAGMAGATLTLKRDNADALSFFAACKYTIDPLSPSKVDPTSEDEKPEIFSKLWDGAVQAAQAKRGADAAARIAKEAAGGKRGAIIGNRSIDECGAN
jgi:GNAT superfamily N-acetyltransferase